LSKSTGQRRHATDHAGRGALARAALSTEEEPGLVVSGESKLMDFPELGDVRKLRKLFDAFTAKSDLLHLLDQSMRRWREDFHRFGIGLRGASRLQRGHGTL
jgi:transcriptional regulator of heat shock response